MDKDTSILDLYTRIPDYSQVKHLGNSDFINTVERLKEEFRKCRASLNEVDSDVEYITENTTKLLNIKSSSLDQEDQVPTRDGGGSRGHHGTSFVAKTTTTTTINNYTPYRVNVVGPQVDFAGNKRGASSRSALLLQEPSSFLSVRSCGLFKPAETASSGNWTSYGGPAANTKGSRYGFGEKYKAGVSSSYEEDFELCSEKEEDSSFEGLSKWCSSPEIYKERDWSPPSNIEKRLEARKNFSSVPSIPAAEEEPRSLPFKANPVPEHVHKPLFDFIMSKNKRRSIRVREKSKQRLLAQVKPFSFTNDKKTGHGHVLCSHGQTVTRDDLVPMRSSRSIKSRRGVGGGGKFDGRGVFRANPAPPRTKALLSAIKLKEQQDYRDLRKRIRAETLMKTSSLPPSMEARSRTSPPAHSYKPCQRTKLDDMLRRYGSNPEMASVEAGQRFWLSEEDAVTDEECSYYESGDFKNAGEHTATEQKSASKKKGRKRNFTPYGDLKLTSVSTGIFESTSNDNHASRLRIQAAKAKELNRLKREEEELLRLMKTDKRRQKLRDCHFTAWRRAGSYSSSQDIAMRRQLRMAAAILERESYKKEKASMLSRVRSAPLLLEGLRERRSEPCKKHKEEFEVLNKLSTPRSENNAACLYSSVVRAKWTRDDDDDQSETVAVAEGSSTDSDNESQPYREFEVDFEQESRDLKGSTSRQNSNVTTQDSDEDNFGYNQEDQE